MKHSTKYLTAPLAFAAAFLLFGVPSAPASDTLLSSSGYLLAANDLHRHGYSGRSVPTNVDWLDATKAVLHARVDSDRRQEMFRVVAEFNRQVRLMATEGSGCYAPEPRDCFQTGQCPDVEEDCYDDAADWLAVAAIAASVAAATSATGIGAPVGAAATVVLIGAGIIGGAGWLLCGWFY